jgi:hypothetical protein
MRRNGVELLTVINPSEPTEATEPKGGWTMDRFKNFLIASAIGGIGYRLYRDRMRTATTGEEAQRASRDFFLFGIGSALLLYLVYGDRLKEMMPRQRMRLNPRKLRLSDLEFDYGQGCGVEGYDAYAGDEFIGEIAAYEDEDGYHYRLADEWAWIPADSLNEAKRGLVDEYNMDLLEEHWLGEENKPSRYFVRLPDEGVSYPKKGSDYYPEGYPLSKALDFARIGSQKGGPREVRRDRRGGKKVRTYKRGKRTWPRTRGQARNLLPAEVPTRLRAS